MNDNKKKAAIISFELIPDLLISEKEENLAEKYLLRVPDVEEQINLLKLIGRVKKAVDVANDK